MEDLVLKGYYNFYAASINRLIVVEDLVLKGYYNCYIYLFSLVRLWKTLF